jgi:hypothetical protein
VREPAAREALPPQQQQPSPTKRPAQEDALAALLAAMDAPQPARAWHVSPRKSAAAGRGQGTSLAAQLAAAAALQAGAGASTGGVAAAPVLTAFQQSMLADPIAVTLAELEDGDVQEPDRTAAASAAAAGSAAKPGAAKGGASRRGARRGSAFTTGLLDSKRAVEAAEAAAALGPPGDGGGDESGAGGGAVVVAAGGGHQPSYGRGALQRLLSQRLAAAVGQ